MNARTRDLRGVGNNRLITTSFAWLVLVPFAARQLKAAIMLGLYAGLRRGEIIDLCWENVSLDHARAEIVNSKGADRVQPLLPRIVDALRVLQAEESRIGGRVFQWAEDGRPWKNFWLSHIFVIF